MGSSGGYDLPEGKDWVKLRFGRVNDRLRELRRGLSALASEVSGVARVGSTAQRDEKYGVPSTDAERAKLANRRVRWFNTDTGFEESYYVQEGSPGLTVPGLTASQLVPNGWYPTGVGPYVLAMPSTTFAASTNNYVAGWDAIVRGPAAAAFFDVLPNGLIRVKRAGVYDVTVWSHQQTGTGTMNYHLNFLATNGSTVDSRVDGNAFPLNTSLATRMHIEAWAWKMGAGTHAGVFCHSGSANVHFGGSTPKAEFLVRYVGPPLALA